MGWSAIIGAVFQVAMLIMKLVMKRQEYREQQAKRFLEYLERWDRQGASLKKYRDNDRLLRERLRRRNEE